MQLQAFNYLETGDGVEVGNGVKVSSYISYYTYSIWQGRIFYKLED